MSDWSSDVCSSDLIAAAPLKRTVALDGLRVLRARPRDVAQRLAGLARIAITGKIGDRHDADEALVAVDYRQTAKLDIAPILEHIIDVLVVKTIFELIAHHLEDTSLGPEIGRAHV